MEIFLNIAWVVLAIAMVALWLRHARRDGHNRRMQLVSLGVLLFILLPAISMTDDLVAAQNPAEVDCCLRRDHDCVGPHSVIPVVPALPLSSFRGLFFAPRSFLVTGRPASPAFESPFLAAVQSRPPPAI